MGALFRKQFKEMLFPLVRNGKKGGIRSRAATVVLLCVLAFAYISIGGSFFIFSLTMNTAFGGGEYSYIPFAVMGILAFLLALFVSGFYANGALYGARDNELLLSMPITPAKILFVRIASIYLNALFMCALVLVPNGIAWMIFGSPDVISALYCVAGIFVFALAVSSVSCVFGFIIAFISSRVKRKNIMQVALTLIFLIAYYIFYFNIRNIINTIVENGAAVAKKIKTYGFLFYAFGRACAGNILYILGFTVCTVAVFALVYYLLSKSFFTVTAGEKSFSGKKTVKASAPVDTAVLAKAPSSVKKALLRRELRRFTGSAAYLINVGLGAFILTVAAVALVIFKNDVRAGISAFERGAPAFIAGRAGDAPRLLAVLITFLISSTVYYTAASVSIEGKNLWILRSSPVPAAEILNAKLGAHLLVSGVPALLFSAAASYVLKTDITGAVWQAVLCLAYVMLFSSVGLWLNVKIPNFDWTDETAVIKQGLPVTLCLFGGWIVSIITVVAAFIISAFVKLDYVILGAAFILILAARLINGYLTKNAERLLLEM